VRKVRTKDATAVEGRETKVYATQLHRLYRVESNLP